MILKHPLTGIQTDVGALPLIPPGSGMIDQSQPNLITISNISQFYGTGWVGVFQKIGIQIVKSPAEQIQVDPQISTQGVEVSMHMKALIL